MSDVADGHAPRQLQDVSLEGLGVAPPGVGEGDPDLTHRPTGPTFDERDRQDHGRLAAADGQGHELTLGVTAGGDLARAAGRTATIVGLLPDGEDRLAAVVVGADVLVAADAEGVIQLAGGHADLPIWTPSTELQMESAFPRFSSPALLPDGPRRELRGLDLGCYCAPGLPCHADVLLELVDQD